MSLARFMDKFCRAIVSGKSADMDINEISRRF